MWALGRPVRPILQAFKSVALIAHQPPVHRSPGHAPVCGHLAHCPTVANYGQDRLVPLLSHAHLPHARERDKSPEVGVTHQPKVCNPSAEGLLRPISRTCTHIGARAGNRTLNLGIKRRLTFFATKRQDVSGRASRIWRSDAFVPRSVLACHRLPRVRCQLSCQMCGWPLGLVVGCVLGRGAKSSGHPTALPAPTIVTFGKAEP